MQCRESCVHACECECVHVLGSHKETVMCGKPARERVCAQKKLSTRMRVLSEARHMLTDQEHPGKHALQTESKTNSADRQLSTTHNYCRQWNNVHTSTR